MPIIDLTAMTSQELNELAQAIARELQQCDQQEKRQVTTRIRELAKSAGLAVNIVPAAKTSSSSLPKYRHPEDATKTWTGRGKRPGWLTALLAQGKALEELAIRTEKNNEVRKRIT